MHKVKRFNYMIKNTTVITSTIIADHLVYLVALSQCSAKMIAPSQLDRKEIQELCSPSLNLVLLQANLQRLESEPDQIKLGLTQQSKSRLFYYPNIYTEAGLHRNSEERTS